MKNSHVLLALAGTIGISLVAVSFTSHKLGNMNISAFATASAHHIQVNKDTVLTPFEYTGKYKFSQREGDGDDIVCTVSGDNKGTEYILNYTDSFFFVPDMKYGDDAFRFFFGINNLTHFRFDYYISDNDDDNGCRIEVNIFEKQGQGYERYEFVNTQYSVSKGEGFYEWTRPTDVDSSIKAGLIFLVFDHFEPDPSFRLKTLDFDWVC